VILTPNQNRASLGLNPWGIVPPLMLKWRKALASVFDGASDAKILCCGDSTTAGKGSYSTATVPALGSWPARLAALLGNAGVPATMGLGIPPAIYSALADTRWTLGTGWSSNTQFGLGWGSAFSYSSGGGNLTYTPGGSQATDTYDIHYLTNTGLGTFTAHATSGTTITQSTSSSASVSKVSVTAASASTSNTVTLSPSSGSLYVVGVDQYLSTTKRVRVGNGGSCGSTSTNWITVEGGGGSNYWGTQQFLQAHLPDLTIICLGINDCLAPASVATYTSNIQSLITWGKTSGDVLLVTMPPTSGSPYTTWEPLYVPALYSLAKTNGIGLFDLYNRFGATWQTSFMYDDYHPNDLGYWDWATGLIPFLLN
jgi:lysophospholipase L1-like esterase